MVLLAIHLLVTLAKFLGPGGVRAVAAESLALKHQLLICSRSRQRAQNLTTLDRLVLGLTTLFMRPHRIPKLSVIIKPATLLKFPKALVDGEIERMTRGAREDLKKRGVKDAENAPIPTEVFQPQAERRVRLGLVVAELVRANGLQAKPEQLQAHIEELSQSYEKPAEVMRWYLSDRQRMAEVEAVVIENNVTQFVLGKAKIVDTLLPFDDLMPA